MREVTGMSRPDTTADLAQRLERHMDPHNDPRIYWAKEVTFDYATDHSVRVDYMRFQPVSNTVSGIEKGDFFCYEIKSSVEDFHSKNGHNFIGDFNYYIMPEAVFEAVEREIPYKVGVFTPNQSDGLTSVKPARRKDRNKPVSEILLMMWRSSRRESVKSRRAQGKANQKGAERCANIECPYQRNEKCPAADGCDGFMEMEKS